MEGSAVQSSKKKNIRGLVLAIAFSAALILFLVKNIEWQLFLNEFHRINFAYLPLLLLLHFFSLWLRAIRWRYLLPTKAGLSLRKLFEATLIGIFATCVLPFRAGEFVRPWALSRWQPVSFSAGFASVVTERVCDVLVLLGMLGLCLSRIDQAPTFVIAGAKALAVLSLLILAAMIVAYLNASFLLRVVRRIVAFFLSTRYPTIADRILSMVEEFINGLRAISSLTELLAVIFWSVSVWVSTVAFYQVGLWTFGEFPSILAGTTVTVLIALAVAAPSAPGFLGTFQIGCVAALTGIYGYTKEFSLAYSVTLHAFQVSIAIATGFYILRAEGLQLGQLWRFEQKS